VRPRLWLFSRQIRRGDVVLEKNPTEFEHKGFSGLGCVWPRQCTNDARHYQNLVAIQSLAVLGVVTQAVGRFQVLGALGCGAGARQTKGQAVEALDRLSGLLAAPCRESCAVFQAGDKHGPV
jgi:hypothetical protein